MASDSLQLFNSALQHNPIFVGIDLNGGIYPKLLNIDDVYQIEKLLGQGAFGSVALAEDLRFHRKVAIKFILYIPEIFDSVLREINLLRYIGVDIQGIPKLYEVFVVERDEKIYIAVVMEYIPGPNLRQIVGEEIDMVNLLSFAYWLFGIISALHSRSIVHRDIKPDNILVHNNKFYLVDYGLACSTNSLSSEVCSVDDKSGTKQYVPPEYFEDKIIDFEGYKAADIWAAATTISELARGGLGFTPQTNQEWYNFITHEGFYLDYAKFGDFADIINPCFALNPVTRPSAENVKNQIENLINLE